MIHYHQSLTCGWRQWSPWQRRNKFGAIALTCASGVGTSTYGHKRSPAAQPGVIPLAWMTAAPAGEIRYEMNAFAASGSLLFAATAET
jgi:hypothetical protein